MKKYILLFALVFAMTGIANAQTTEAKSTITKAETTQKVESLQKVTPADKAVTTKVAKTSGCKEMSSKSCCKKGKGEASASNEKACCADMAEAKEGKACCDKKAEKMKAEAKKKEVTKKG
jgi:hypothetical protein